MSSEFYIDYTPVPKTSTGRLDKKKRLRNAPLDDPDNLGHIPETTEEEEISVSRHIIHWAIVNSNEEIENIYEALGLI